MARGVEGRRLQHDRRRRGGHLAVGAAHHARQRDRAALVGDDDVTFLQRTVDAVQRRHPLAAAGAPDLDPAAQLVGVERVQRVAELQHHVVGGIDQVRDRAHPARRQPHPHPQRTGADADAGDDAGVVAGTGAGVADLDVDAAAHRQRHLARLARLGNRQTRAEQRRHLARDADVAERIGAVGRDVDVQHLVEQTGVASELGARGRVRRQNQDSVTLLAHAELDLAAQHPRRHHAADLAPFQLQAARQRRARWRPRDLAARRRHVARAAHDLLFVAAAHDADQRQLVGPGVRPLATDLRHDHAADVAAAPLDRFDLQADQRQLLCDRVGRDAGLEVDELTQPVERDLHRNCARKRVSCS